MTTLDSIPLYKPMIIEQRSCAYNSTHAGTSLKRCSQCRTAFYCAPNPGQDPSTTCQAKHWSIHKQACHSVKQSPGEMRDTAVRSVASLSLGAVMDQLKVEKAALLAKCALLQEQAREGFILLFQAEMDNISYAEQLIKNVSTFISQPLILSLAQYLTLIKCGQNHRPQIPGLCQKLEGHLELQHLLIAHLETLQKALRFAGPEATHLISALTIFRDNQAGLLERLSTFLTEFEGL